MTVTLPLLKSSGCGAPFHGPATFSQPFRPSFHALDQQIAIITALCEGIGQRAVARLTNTDCKTVARLGLRVGRGCAELHDRMVVGVRTQRLELDELWCAQWLNTPGRNW
jgi:hypothetical protein